MRVLAKDVKEVALQGGKTIEVSGWVHRIRDLGAVNFVILRDRSGIVQLVLDKKTDLTHESVITVRGEAAYCFHNESLLPQANSPQSLTLVFFQVEC